MSIYKIVVLGQGRVGKTSMSLKYVNNEFDPNQQSTINASYLQKKQRLDNNQVVRLAIWDTAGQQKYNAIAPVYYRESVGAIIAYQITSVESFEKVKKWVSQLEEHAPKGLVLTIAGNKADLENQRKVNNADVEKFAKKHGANHFVVSAKAGIKVNEMFKDLAERIYKKQNQSKIVAGLGKKNPRLTVQSDKNRQAKKDKKCC